MSTTTTTNTAMYPEYMVSPMREELTTLGFEELKTPENVNEALQRKGTTLLFVNSVCGCAAAMARPAAKLALDNDKKPENLTTVFAGMEKDAVDTARQNMLPYPPSSPCIALFKDGKLVHMIERMHIEGHPAEMIAENLKSAFNEFC